MNKDLSNSVARLALAFALGLTATAHAPAAQQSAASPSTGAASLSPVDRSFAVEAEQINLLAIAGSRTVLEKATNGFVRTVGQSILDDHRTGQRELEQAAAAAHLSLPTQLDARHQRELDQIRPDSPGGIDEAYLHTVGVRAHQEEIQAARQEVQAGTNPQLIDFARRRMHVLEAQVAMAQRLADAPRAK